MRIDFTDPKWPEWVKYLYPCDCRETEFLYISWWDDESGEDRFAFLEVIPAVWTPSYWERIKAAAKIIAGQPHYHGGILLNPETVERLRETLDEIGRGENHGKVEHTNEDHEHVHKDADT